MSNGFNEINVDLSHKQKTEISKAVSGGHGVRIRLNYGQLNGKNKIHVYKRQYNKIMTAKSKGKGCIIEFTKPQLDKMQKGGFLAPLLIGLATSLAPMLFQKFFPDTPAQQEGHGIVPQNNYDIIQRPQNGYDIAQYQNNYDVQRPQNGYDIDQSGHGVIQMANGETIRQHVMPDHNPSHSGYGLNIPGYGLNMPGSGLNIPGNYQMPGKKGRGQKQLKMPLNYQGAYGIQQNFVAPQSEAFQMLQ